jgi:hypothetical protein
VVLRVTISHILKNENYELCFLEGTFVDQITTGKKGTVVWPLVRMFGGSMSLDCFGGFPNQITTGKKKVQSPGYRLQCLGGWFHELGLFWRVRRYVFWQVP